jgi:hypothetical protein
MMNTNQATFSNSAIFHVVRFTCKHLSTLLIFLLTVISPLSAAPPPERVVSKEELLSPKRGTVVDSKSGQGIADAFVVINWVTDSSGIPGVVNGGRWCDLQDVTKTDADGLFSFDDVRQNLDMSNVGKFENVTPFGDSTSVHQMSYRIFVFKPGYLGIGEEEKIYSAKHGWGSEWAIVPDATMHSDSVVITPIRLTPENLDAESKWVYSAVLSKVTRCSDRMAHFRDAPRWSELHAQLTAGIATLPCQMPPDATIEPASTNALRVIMVNQQFEKQLLAVTGGDPRATSANIRASQLCRATDGIVSPP